MPYKLIVKDKKTDKTGIIGFATKDGARRAAKKLDRKKYNYRIQKLVV